MTLKTFKINTMFLRYKITKQFPLLFFVLFLICLTEVVFFRSPFVCLQYCNVGIELRLYFHEESAAANFPTHTLTHTHSLPTRTRTHARTHARTLVVHTDGRF